VTFTIRKAFPVAIAFDDFCGTTICRSHGPPDGGINGFKKYRNTSKHQFD